MATIKRRAITVTEKSISNLNIAHEKAGLKDPPILLI
tara:strand:- start:300 stop:410 length:111 start_codon:yes stop_codon:yes gene_type:complete